MKQLLPVSLFMVVSITMSCSANNTNEAKTPKHKASTQAQAIAPAPTGSLYYKRMQGTVAGLPVVAHLSNANEYERGTYYYVNSGKWISLYEVGDDSQAVTNQMILEEAIAGNTDHTAKFIGKLTQNSYSGQWLYKSKSQPFSLKEEYPEGAFAYDVVALRDSIPYLRKGKPTPASMVITSTSIAPKPEHPYYDFIAQELMAIIGVRLPNTKNWQEVLKNKHKQYAQEYITDMDTTLSDNDVLSKEDMGILSFEQMHKVDVYFNDAYFLVLGRHWYQYMGGAHGMHGTEYHVLDLKQQKTLRLSNVVTDKAALQPALERNFRKTYGLAANASLQEILFENELLPNENFYLTTMGIGFEYAPYEVSAYAVGAVNVFIPYKEIMPLLTPEFKKRMGL